MKHPLTITPKTEILPIILIISTIIASFYFYQYFPEQVPTHWNISGTIDGYSGKFFAAFFFPLLNLVMYLLFLFLPLIDPQKERYQQFASVYHLFKNLIIALLTVVYFMVGLAGIGVAVPVDLITPVLVGLLFVIIGNYMGKIKRNWFFGARTPWTLSSEENWNKTNRLSGKLFIVSGVLMILEIILPLPAKLPVFIFAILLAAVVPVVYSALLYLKEKKL